MKNIENIPEEIFDLIGQKSYAELNQVEQKQIEGILTRSEYDHFYSIVQGFKDLDGTIPMAEPNPSFISKDPVFKRILNHRIPVYQAAAAVLFFILSTVVVSNSINSVGPENGNESISNEEKNGRLIQNKAVNLEQEKQGQSLSTDDYPEELIFSL